MTGIDSGHPQNGGRKPRSKYFQGNRPYSDKQGIFLAAVERYKTQNHTNFPSCWEIVCIAVECGIVSWRNIDDISSAVAEDNVQGP